MLCARTLADDSFAVFPVQVGFLDHVVLGVHPIHAMAGVIDGESVRPEQVGVGDDLASRAVHVGVLDPRSVSPVRPVNLSTEIKDGGKVRSGSQTM